MPHGAVRELWRRSVLRTRGPRRRPATGRAAARAEMLAARDAERPPVAPRLMTDSVLRGFNGPRTSARGPVPARGLIDLCAALIAAAARGRAGGRNAALAPASAGPAVFP